MINLIYVLINLNYFLFCIYFCKRCVIIFDNKWVDGFYKKFFLIRYNLEYNMIL